MEEVDRAGVAGEPGERVAVMTTHIEFLTVKAGHDRDPKRAESMRKAHFAMMAVRSAQKRRQRQIGDGA